jgi:hypothetical protein
VVQDELRFAKSLTVYKDGSMLYRNEFGVDTSLVNADVIKAAVTAIGR